MRQPCHIIKASSGLCIWLLLLLTPLRSPAAPTFDTGNPLSFFTTVASRLVSAQLGLNLTQLPVYPTNLYTPSVQRLLQVTANIYDVTTTNFYPTVFRPLFSSDATGTNIFITGYQQVVSVTGLYDPQLAQPADVAYLPLIAGPYTNLAINIYGIPWILGAKTGLPAFNQLSLLNQVQVSRKLQFTRPNTNAPLSQYQTNQCYIISVSNNIAVTFWNSYSNAYPRPVQIYAQDIVRMIWSNSPSGAYGGTVKAFNLQTSLSNWTGSAWNLKMVPAARTPATAAFVPASWGYAFIPMTTFAPSSGTFQSLALTNSFDPGITPLPPINLLTTNWFYSVILDGTNVIDYVQIAGPSDAANITDVLADPTPTNYSMWSTNLNQNGVPYGVYNQMFVSMVGSIPNLSFWDPAPGFPNGTGSTSIADQQAYFRDFFFPGNTGNTALQIQAPYLPTRTLFCSYLLQANDPLVHYQVSDLGGLPGTLARWYNGSYFNGLWQKSDDPLNDPLPVILLNILGRYQPWGKPGVMNILTGVDTNSCNLAIKDPCVIGSDNWNFPTNQSWNLNWLGQVHRGTPWQTIYLKSPDILAEASNFGSVGTNTWMAWMGLNNAREAQLTSPTSDWQLVSLLADLLNTNDLTTQFSINNPDPNAWAVQFDGFNVISNTLSDILAGTAMVQPTFNAYTISSNSPPAAFLASAIQSYRSSQPNQLFHVIGDLLAIPQLSQQSPYLNWNDAKQQINGINDTAYEAIPSQLLPLLRADSIGALLTTNGQTQLQFSGYDGHAYAVQASADLVNWISIATNSPVNGSFTLPLPTSPANAAQFYRTLLLQ